MQHSLKRIILFPTIIFSVILLIGYVLVKEYNINHLIVKNENRQHKQLQAPAKLALDSLLRASHSAATDMAHVVQDLTNKGLNIMIPEDRQSFDSYLTNYQNIYGLNEIIIYDKTTGSFYSSTDTELFNGVDIKSLPWYVQAIKNPDNNIDHALSNVYINERTKKSVFSAMAISQDGRWVVLIARGINKAQEQFSTLSQDNFNQVLLVGPSLTIISSLIPEQIGKTISTIGLKLNDTTYVNKDETYTVQWQAVHGFYVASLVSPTPMIEAMNQSIMTVILNSLLLFCVVISCVIYSTRVMEKNLLETSVVSNQIKQGDLVIALPTNGRLRELNRFNRNLNTSISGLRETLVTIIDGNSITEKYNKRTQEVIENGTSTVDSALEQTRSIASAITELAESSRSIADSISTSKDVSNESAALCVSSQKTIDESGQLLLQLVEYINKTSGRVENLQELANSIGKITETIHDISEQTNLLALNASIEAARAGEAGRGFAVVADEVRQLSQKIAKSTQNIQLSINDIQNSVVDVNEQTMMVSDIAKSNLTLSTSVHDAFNQLTETIHFLHAHMEQIAASAEEQSLTSNEIARNIVETQNISEQTQEYFNLIKNNTNKTNIQIEQMIKTANQFKITADA